MIFSVVLRPLWLNPNDSVAAVTLVNEALLSRHFLFFVAVTACYSWSIGEGFTVVFPNLRFDGDLSSAPNRIFRRQLPSESPPWNLGARIGHPLYTAFKCARVGWPNIGPAAAAPAGPVPTALLSLVLYQSISLAYILSKHMLSWTSSNVNWILTFPKMACSRQRKHGSAWESTNSLHFCEHYICGKYSTQCYILLQSL